MKKRNESLLRAISVGMIAVLLLISLPCSAMADSVRMAVTNCNTYVFQKPNIKSAHLAIPAGFGLHLVAVNGSIAMVENNGIIAYAYLPHLIVGDEIPSAGDQGTPAPEAPSAPQGTRAIAIVDTCVFQRPDIRSAHLWIPAGTGMYVVGINGSIAMVQNNGITAYAYLPHLLLEGQSLPAEVPAPAPDTSAPSGLPSFADAYQSGKFSNEQLTYLFLRQMMGYNNAAAAGVLANINYESGFKTAITGDGGTSYGLCQWHGSRMTRLNEFCQQYGVSVDLLVSQLAYLKYELENFYPLVHNYLAQVPDTGAGAYDAGYFFCWNFENPANREAQSIKRGQSAENTYYPRYSEF